MDINLLLIVFGVLTLIVLIGVSLRKIIFFDTEKDLFSNIGILIFISSSIGIFSLYPDLGTYTIAQKIFFWIGLVSSILFSLSFMASSFRYSIQGNGIVLGLIIFIYKLLFTLVITLLIFGKIGEILDNKDRRTRANRAPVLTILILLRIFYTPIKKFLVNGDAVRQKRLDLSLDN